MGHITTSKFELQLEKKDNCLLCFGVNSIKEAKEQINSYLNSDISTELTGKCLLWGNSKAGKTYLNNHNADYYLINAYNLNIEACAIPLVY